MEKKKPTMKIENGLGAKMSYVLRDKYGNIKQTGVVIPKEKTKEG